MVALRLGVVCTLVVLGLGVVCTLVVLRLGVVCTLVVLRLGVASVYTGCIEAWSVLSARWLHWGLMLSAHWLDWGLVLSAHVLHWGLMLSAHCLHWPLVLSAHWSTGCIEICVVHTLIYWLYWGVVRTLLCWVKNKSAQNRPFGIGKTKPRTCENGQFWQPVYRKTALYIIISQSLSRVLHWIYGRKL